MASEETIQHRILEEQAKIEVPSYQAITLDGAWKRRSASMWMLAGLGAIAGAGLGAAALVAPAIFAELSVTAGMVGTSMAVFSALGLSAGWGVGVMVGFPSGAVASGLKELERRTIARDIEQKIRDNPEASVVLGERQLPAPEEGSLIRRYFNWKTALLFAGLGAIGGAIFAGALAAVGVGGTASASVATSAIQSFAMPAMTMLFKGAELTTSLVTAYTVGLGASFGAIFGLNFPLMATKLADLGGSLLSGKAIGAPWPEDANLPLQPVLSPAISEPEPKLRSFAAREQPAMSHEARIQQARQDAERSAAQLGA